MLGILFDLDGTLLSIDLESFLKRYFAALETAMGPLLPGGMTGAEGLRALSVSTEAMMEPHAGETNRDVFHKEFERRTGLDLESSWAVFEQFYANEFPALQGDCGPAPGARAAIEAARRHGLKVAVATNPIFPEVAVRHRLTWAGLDGVDFDVVTTYENMHSCKPRPDYFRQTASMMNVPPERCLMVGDDRYLDLAAADVGMRTYYVGTHADAHADFRGGLEELSALIPRLIEADNP